jgi:hypothetical protein
VLKGWVMGDEAWCSEPSRHAGLPEEEPVAGTERGANIPERAPSRTNASGARGMEDVGRLGKAGEYQT